MTASIKGVALQLAIAPILRGIDRGRISWDQLEVSLHQQDLVVLEEKVIPGLWYPIATFDRLLGFSMASDGFQSDRQWVQVGFQVASRILTNHVFDDMVSAAAARGDRAGHTLIGLAPLLLNFSHWSFESRSDDGRHFRVEVTEAEEFPKGLALIVQGLIEYLSTRVFGERSHVCSERPTPDTLVFCAQP